MATLSFCAAALLSVHCTAFAPLPSSLISSFKSIIELNDLDAYFPHPRKNRSRLFKKRRKDISIDPDDWYGDVNINTSSYPTSRRSFPDSYDESARERIADIQLDDAISSQFQYAIVTPKLLGRSEAEVGIDPAVSLSEQSLSYLDKLGLYYQGTPADKYESALFSDEDDEEDDDDDDFISEEEYDSGDGSEDVDDIKMYDGSPESLEWDDADSLTDVSEILMTSNLLSEMTESGNSFDPLPVSDTYSRVIIGAVSEANAPTLVANLQNIGAEVRFNFDDFESNATDSNWSIEQIASFKARKVFELTGIPCIAEGTNFEVAPVIGGVGRKSSHFRLNTIGPFISKLIQILRPVSDPNRMCRFRTVMCYYDGIDETFEYGECEVAIIFAGTTKALITGTKSIMSMIETLLDYWDDEIFRPQSMRTPADTTVKSRENPLLCGAEMLQECVLRKSHVLPNQIIDVSQFMESYIDTVLMEECAKDLAHRFASLRPNKILTIGTTGLAIASPLALLLQIPLVYARKQRTMVMGDYHIATYTSRTQEKQKEVIVSKGHLSNTDKVLIVDDFLSAGNCQDALLRIIFQAGATPIGIAVLIEKGFEKGRMSLSGYDIPIESLVNIKSVQDGSISLHP